MTSRIVLPRIDAGNKNVLNTKTTPKMNKTDGNSRFSNFVTYGRNLNSPVRLIVEMIDVVIKNPRWRRRHRHHLRHDWTKCDTLRRVRQLPCVALRFLDETGFQYQSVSDQILSILACFYVPPSTSTPTKPDDCSAFLVQFGMYSPFRENVSIHYDRTYFKNTMPMNYIAVRKLENM